MQITSAELRARINELRQAEAQALAQANALNGAALECERLLVLCERADGVGADQPAPAPYNEGMTA